MARYSLECLGSLKVQNSQFNGKKALLLLAYLVLEPGAKTSNELSELFFPGVRNSKGRLSDAKWKLNHHLDSANNEFEIVTRDYRTREVITDVQLLMEACDKGVSELETIKTLFCKGECFKEFKLGQNEDELSEEVREWILVWREKVNVRVWDVVLLAAGNLGDEGHLLIEEVYETTKTLPEHDIDYCYALLKVGGSYLTEIIKDRLDLESLMSEEEAQVLLEERNGKRIDFVGVQDVTQDSGDFVNDEATTTTTNHAEVGEDSSRAEKNSNVNPEGNAERGGSSVPPHLVDLNALLELIKSKLGSFHLPTTSTAKRQVISMPWSIVAPLLLLAFTVLVISVVMIYQYRDMRQISTVSASDSNVNQVSQSGENNTITITQGSPPMLASALPLEQRTLQVSSFVNSDICVTGGETLEIKASGSLSVGDWLGYVTPEGKDQGLFGVSLDSYNIVPKYSHGALLCKLTTEDIWRECGSEETFVAGNVGCLEFDINDIEKQNNSGAFSVTMTIRSN